MNLDLNVIFWNLGLERLFHQFQSSRLMGFLLLWSIARVLGQIWERLFANIVSYFVSSFQILLGVLVWAMFLGEILLKNCPKPLLPSLKRGGNFEFAFC